MFVYFLQKKGFLDGGDFDYLRHRFAHHRGDLFASFLLPLFFTGFARPDGAVSRTSRTGRTGDRTLDRGRGLARPESIATT